MRFVILGVFYAVTNVQCAYWSDVQCVYWSNIDIFIGTGCGRKNSSIWEANKFKTKDDTANIFLFLESTQNAVLHQCVLNKSSLKWRPWILINWCSLSVVVHELENHFRCNGSNFLPYHLLQSFQSLSCLSKVWYPKVNRFLIRNSLPSTKRKADAKCTLCCYRRPAILYKLLNNKGSMFSKPCYGIHWKRYVHRCSTTRSPPLYALPTRSYAPPKSGCSFCRILYIVLPYNLHYIVLSYSLHYIVKCWRRHSAVLKIFGGIFP